MLKFSSNTWNTIATQQPCAGEGETLFTPTLLIMLLQ